MNELNITIFFIPVVFLLLVYLISVIAKTRKESLEERQEELEELDQQIEIKYSQLMKLNEQLETIKIDRKVSLPHSVNNVLDLYDKSNIQISADIIEELARNRFNNEKEIFDYIENQRYYWKLENTKKPYKKVK